MSRSQEKFIIDENGRKTAVVVPVRRYARLLEDLHDLSVIAERRDEPTVSLKIMSSSKTKRRSLTPAPTKEQVTLRIS